MPVSMLQTRSFQIKVFRNYISFFVGHRRLFWNFHVSAYLRHSLYITAPLHFTSKLSHYMVWKENFMPVSMLQTRSFQIEVFRNYISFFVGHRTETFLKFSYFHVLETWSLYNCSSPFCSETFTLYGLEREFHARFYASNQKFSN